MPAIQIFINFPPVLLQIIQDFVKLPNCLVCDSARDPDNFDNNICNKHCGCTSYWPGFDAPCCKICHEECYQQFLEERANWYL